METQLSPCLQASEDATDIFVYIYASLRAMGEQETEVYKKLDNSYIGSEHFARTQP